MDSPRAREILLLYRPDSSDTNDPEFKEALDQVRRDPALRQWFEAHCARQSQIRLQLKQISAPENLKQRILDEAGKCRVIVWWRRPAFQAWAAAAAILLMAGLFVFRDGTSDEGRFAAYRNRVVSNVQRDYQMEMMTNNLTEIRQYLASKQWPADYVLSKPMERLAGVGCAALLWRGNKVSLVCLDSERQTDLFLFIIDRSALPDPPPADQPRFARVRKLMSASWSHDGKTYILAGAGDEEFVRRFL